jgi:hypothetical protein
MFTGYHLHRSGLFIPHPFLTTANGQRRAASRERHMNHQNETASDTARYWSSRLSLLSESEGEEVVSEANRDARLA